MQTTHSQSVDGRQLVHVIFERQTPSAAAPTIEVIFEVQSTSGALGTGRVVIMHLTTTLTDTREPATLSEEERRMVYDRASEYADEI